MKAKSLVAAFLIVALFGFVSAPPAQAELVTITVILAASLATFYVVNEGVKSQKAEKTSEQADLNTNFQANADGPAPEPGRP